MYKLYYAPGACSFASHAILNELNVDYELVKVDIKKKSPELVKVNPRGAVPVLTDDDTVVTENVAIQLYLTDKHPGPLRPEAGTAKAADLYRWQLLLATTIHPAWGPLFKPAKFIEDEAQHPALKKLATERIAKEYENIDHYLQGKEYLVGHEATLADFYLFIFGVWGKKLPTPVQDLSNFGAFMQRMANKPSIQKTLETEGIRPFN